MLGRYSILNQSHVGLRHLWSPQNEKRAVNSWSEPESNRLCSFERTSTQSVRALPDVPVPNVPLPRETSEPPCDRIHNLPISLHGHGRRYSLHCNFHHHHYHQLHRRLPNRCLLKVTLKRKKKYDKSQHHFNIITGTNV